MKLKFGEQIIEPTILAQDTKVSPHTGQQLDQLEIGFQIPRKPNQELKQLISKMKQDGIESVNDENETEKMWSVSELMSSFRDGDRYQDVRWQITERETLNATTLSLNNIEFEPDKYEEEWVNTRIEIVTIATIPEKRWQELGALLTSGDEVTVVRKGINPQPLIMHLKNVAWSRVENDIRVGLVLIEPEDKVDTAKLKIRLPFGKHLATVRREHTHLTVQFNHLIEVLQGKGLLTDDDRDSILTVSDEEFNTQSAQLDRVHDVDRYLGL